MKPKAPPITAPPEALKPLDYAARTEAGDPVTAPSGTALTADQLLGIAPALMLPQTGPRGPMRRCGLCDGAMAADQLYCPVCVPGGVPVPMGGQNMPHYLGSAFARSEAAGKALRK